MEGGDEKERGYKRKKRKRDEGIGKKGRNQKRFKKKKLVIELLSNIKEQTSSNFAEDDIFNITFFIFILLSSKSFPVFILLTKAQFSDPLSTNSLFLDFLGLSPST